jgi:hypothetical protein
MSRTWPCPGCGAHCEDDGGTAIELWLSHTCGTAEATIAMDCPYCSCQVQINHHELVCTNGHVMDLERALREVARYGEALTAFGALLQSTIAERNIIAPMLIPPGGGTDALTRPMYA